MPGSSKGQETDTMERLNKLAIAEYQEHAGKLLEVEYLCGYDDHDDSGDWPCRAIVRVDKTNEDSIIHWNYEWLDPYWDVTVVRMIEPPTGTGNIRLNSAWIDGPSHNANTGERNWKHVRVLTKMEMLTETLRRWVNGKC